MKYPRLWIHKKSKDKVRVMPWWECISPVVTDGDFLTVEKEAIRLKKSNAFKVGVLVQIGYLLENEHGVWLGIGFTAKKAFKDMGEWKKK